MPLGERSPRWHVSSRKLEVGRVMPWFEDVTPYTYWPQGEHYSDDLLNVGWLFKDHPFVTGSVPEGFVRKLLRLAVEHAVNRSRGWQNCFGCEEYPIAFDYEGRTRTLGSGEIRVKGDVGHYAAPNLIYHYVVAHGYCPPEDFVVGVLKDPRVAE
jgi:hypothetical protein